MRVLPGPMLDHPGDRGPIAYLWWLARHQWSTMALGTLFDVTWLTGLAVTPWAVGRAIDQGILGGDQTALLRWVLVLLVVALVRAWAEAMRDRTGISNWNQAAFRSARLLGHHLTRVGQVIGKQYSVGEVLAVQEDAFTLARVYFLLGGLTSALISYSVVAVIVLRASVLLGLFVLIGVPVFGLAIFLVVRPLHRRQDAQRDASGAMTSLAADAVTGLRILRGIGGEAQFLTRYRQASARTRRTGLAMANPIAALEGLQVLLGGILIVVLTWMGSVLVLRGELQPGELVTFYGYAAYLLTPVNLVADNLSTVVPAVIGARRLMHTLGIRSATSDGTPHLPAPATGTPLVDGRSGVELAPGTLVVLTSDDLVEPRRVLERFARVDDTDLAKHSVRWGSTDTDQIGLADLRKRILLVDTEPYLYSGTLRDTLDPLGRHDDVELHAAMAAVGATDIEEATDQGLDHEVAAGGRNLSGGERQRLGLARALLADAEFLLLDDPTSSVDAHTEHRIATGLTATRPKDSCTVIATASPLLVGGADIVYLFTDGDRPEAWGPPDALRADPQYRRIIQRGEAVPEGGPER